MGKDLIFDLIYQITSLESVSKLDNICSKIFELASNHLKKAFDLFKKNNLNEGKKEFYIGDTYLLAIDQILGERLGPVMLSAQLKRYGVNNSLEFMNKIDQKREDEIDSRLEDLVDFYKVIKKWKQNSWGLGKRVLEFKNRIAEWEKSAR